MSFFSLTDTCPHVHRSHEAIVTQTAVFPRNVGALSSVTDVWSLFTLVNICKKTADLNLPFGGNTTSKTRQVVNDVNDVNVMVKLWDMMKHDHTVTLYPAFYYLSRCGGQA